MRTLLLISPAIDHPLLNGGLFKSRPPRVWRCDRDPEWSAEIPGDFVWPEDYSECCEDCSKDGASCEECQATQALPHWENPPGMEGALVLVWEDQVVSEGVDRALRLLVACGTFDQVVNLDVGSAWRGDAQELWRLAVACTQHIADCRLFLKG